MCLGPLWLLREAYWFLFREYVFINVKDTGSANSPLIIHVNVKFHLEVDENKDAFPLHLSSWTPCILSI